MHISKAILIGATLVLIPGGLKIFLPKGQREKKTITRKRKKRPNVKGDTQSDQMLN